MNFFLVVVALAAVASGCASNGPVPVQMQAFPLAEYETLQKTGTGTVRGQIFLKMTDGVALKGAGERITLRPMTSYAQAGAKSPASITNGLDHRIAGYDRSTVADSDGRFEFKDVAPGPYYVSGQVIWYRTYRRTNGSFKQVAFLIESVTAKNSVVSEVMLVQ